MRVIEVFHQNYSLEEDGIPPHWCCGYIDASGYKDYQMFSTKKEAYDFAMEHGYYDEDDF